ncbi:MAG: cell division topological specificity factor MinE [Pantoea sp. Brub]|nr:cell division topological specificity factor MinE [Pantoea sp. Brub]
MIIFNFFLSKKKNTAAVAKERLQIITSEENRHSRIIPYYFPQLQKDIIDIICKYIKIDPKLVNIKLDKNIDNISTLELNIILSRIQK